MDREDLPLKSNNKPSRCEEYLGGSKFINISFGSLSIIITVALFLQIYYGDYQVVPHGSVATDSLECSEIGTKILKKGGNAIDAAIASTFCLSVFSPHITGLDADGQLLLYNHKLRTPPILIDFSDLSISSDLPRLVLGLAYCHKIYGLLPWKDLIQPSIKFAKKGFLVSRGLVEAIALKNASDLFGRLEASQLVRIRKLGETLQSISEVTEKQLDSFLSPDNSPTETEAYKFKFKMYNIYVPNVPSIGPMLSIIMKQLELANFTKENTGKTEFYHKLIEITRIVYNDFQVSLKFHEGVSTNVAVIDKDDNYVSLISGLPSLFGSQEMTSSGYIMNSKPKGLKLSKLPIIIVDSKFVCGKRFIFGANNIVLAAQIISTLLINEENATESIEYPRFHMTSNGAIGLENFHSPPFDEDVKLYLKALSAVPFQVTEPYDSINIIEKKGDHLISHSDSRGGGIASRFK